MNTDLNSQHLMNDPKQFLHELLLERKLKNRSYSARALARDLGVSQSFLSQLMTGSRNASIEQKLKLAGQLGIEVSVSSDEPHALAIEVLKHQEEHEKILKYWYHFAILELTKTKQAPRSPEMIAKRIGISELEAKTAVERLIEYGYLKIEKKRYVVTGSAFLIDAKKSTQALREYHQAALKAAHSELQYFDQSRVDQRFFQTLFVSTTPENVKKANALVQEFQKKLLRVLVKEEGDEVFQMSLQLFSIEQPNPTVRGNHHE